jgi:hypothetical protein
MGSVVVYHSTSNLPSGAKALLDKAGAEDFFLGIEWFDLLFQSCLSADWTPAIFVVGDSEGIFFMATRRKDAWYAPRRLTSATNFYSMTYRPIFAPGCNQAETIVAFATAVAKARTDMVEFRNISVEDSTANELTYSLERAGFLVEEHQQFENWYEVTDGMSGKSYFDARPSRLRNTIERRYKKASKERKLRTTIYSSGGEDVTVGIDDWQRIYAKSWKEPEQYPTFIPGLLTLCALKGILRLGVFYVDDQPASAQIWLVVNKKATIYKLAYDEAYESLSVGSILTKQMFDRALDVDHVEEVDYGSGSEPYKKDWMTQRRIVVGLTAYNRWTPRGALAASCIVAAKRIKKLRALLPARHT